MKVEVKFLATFRNITGTPQVTLDIEGNNVGDIVDVLVAKYGERFKQELLDSEGSLAGHVRILVNGNFVPRDDPFNYQVKERDTVYILPPLVGGR